jgi:flagellin-like protein
MNGTGEDDPLANGQPRDRRGQSEVIGIVLVLALVIASATIVVVIGSTAVGDTEDELSDGRAEKSMTQFAAKAGLVALEESDSQTVDLPTGQSEQYHARENEGWMNITAISQTDESDEWNLSVNLGAIVYEGENKEIAYQGGGVFTASEYGGQLISPPEFHYREGTLTLPIVTVTGDAHVGSRASVTRSDVNREFPLDSNDNRTNPLDNHVVTVTVQSEFYRGWGEYFEERTDGEVDYDPPNNEVTLTLVTPLEAIQADDGIRALGAGGDFSVSGNAGDPCGVPAFDNPYVNSYNSSDTTQDYCDQLTSGSLTTNGNITYGGDVDVSAGTGSSDIKGTIVSGGEVEISGSPGTGQPSVSGDVFHEDGCNTSGGPSDCDANVGGVVDQRDGPNPSEDVRWQINRTVDRLAQDDQNDNSDPGVPIDNSDRINFSASGPSDEATLEAGSYYLDKIDFSGGDTINLNTSSGNVLLAIEDYIEVGDGREIKVSGGGQVEIYVNGTDRVSSPSGTPGSGDDNILTLDNGTVNVAHDNATELVVLGKPNANVTMKSGEFTGVIYAPPGPSGTGTGKLYLDHSSVFGAAIIGSAELSTGSSVHYDEALSGGMPLSNDFSVVRITFLHVTQNEITVD